MMKFDEFLQEVGEFGYYQKLIYFLVSVTQINTALHKLIWVFVGALPEYRCRIDAFDLMYNESQYTLDEEMWNKTVPWSEKYQKWDGCHIYNISSSDIIKPQTECHHWVYDQKQYKNSVVTDFDLVCGRNWMRALVQFSFGIGELIGSITWGYLADRFGRRNIFLLSVSGQTTFGILSAYAGNFYVFIMCRICVGIFTPGVFLVAYVIGMELVGPSKRHIAGTAMQFFFAGGYTIVGILAYYIREWQKLQLIISLPGVLYISYFCFLPESARWLIAKNRMKDAANILKKIATSNNKPLSDNTIFQLTKEEEGSNDESAGFGSLFTNPNLRCKTINLCFNWFANSFVYYGLALNTSNLGGDHYLNFIIFALMEFPVYLFCMYGIDWFGRRCPLCISMLVTGISLIATQFIDEAGFALVALAMVGKLGITTSYAVIYVFSAELFPTVVRNAGMGISSMCARIGVAVAPIVILLADYNKATPLVIFGSVSLLAGLLALLLPETKRAFLPETIEDGETFGKKQNKAFNGESPAKVSIVGSDKLKPDGDAVALNAKLLEVDADGATVANSGDLGNKEDKL